MVLSSASLLWTPEDEFVDIGPLPPSDAVALAISDRDASGRIDIINGSQFRTTYTAGSQAAGTPQIVSQNLGFIYDDSANGNPGHSHLTLISSTGLIGGQTTSGPTLETAAVYSDAEGWKNLGTLAPAKARSWNDSWVTAMNNTGLVVGQSLNGQSSVVKVKQLTFLYSDAFGMVDLLKFVDGMPPDSHPEALGAPRAINDNGWICGTSQWGPYVLIPKPAN